MAGAQHIINLAAPGPIGGVTPDVAFFTFINNFGLIGVAATVYDLQNFLEKDHNLDDVGDLATTQANLHLVADAPSDGNVYGRQDGAWTISLANGVSLSDFLRKDQNLADVDDLATTQANLHMVSDAPSDNRLWARRNGGWSLVSTSGAVVESITGNVVDNTDPTNPIILTDVPGGCPVLVGTTPPGAHRRWKVEITGGSAGAFEVAQFSGHDGNSATDLFLGADCSASDLGSPGNMVDNDLTTFSSEGSGGAIGIKIIVDLGLGNDAQITRLVVVAGATNGINPARTCSFSYSDDGATWTVIGPFDFPGVAAPDQTPYEFSFGSFYIPDAEISPAIARTADVTAAIAAEVVRADAAYDAMGAAAAAQAASQPLDSDLTAIAALATISFGRGALTWADAASARAYIGAGTSVFDGAFSSLTGKPTTIGGYGITDFNSLGDVRWLTLSSLGTGVATALAVNIGSAGAFLVFNGAGGTPSSITLTNATGTAAGLTAGTVTTNANLTGPVTSTGNATAIANGAISNAMLANAAVANLSGTNTGDVANTALTTGTLAQFSATTSAQLRGVLSDELGTGAALFDGATPTSLTLTNATGLPTAGILDAAVTLAKQANMATASVVYRKTAGSGAPEINTLATLKTDLGLTGTNSGDQTSVSGNAGTATALATGRTIGMTGDVVWTSPTFDGSGNVTAAGAIQSGVVTNAMLAGSIDLTTKVTGALPQANIAALTGDVTKPSGSGVTTLANIPALPGTNLTGTAASLTAGNATILATARAIYGNSFDGSAALAQIIASTYGGTGNGYTKFIGPTTSEKTFTLPNASATVLTDNAAVTVAQGGTGRATLTLNNVLLGNGTTAVQQIAPGTSGNVLTSDGTTWASTAAAAGVSAANPSASVGLSAVNGSAATFLRSDGAPALSQSIAPTWTGVHTFSPTARSSGVAAYLTLNIPADTLQTAATEAAGFKTVTATRQWATSGTVALQRENWFAGPTYSSQNASQTFTDACTVYIDKPLAGTNAIFTRAHSLAIVDATSSTTSVTGGFIVATTLGTTATSVGIGGGNINLGGALGVGSTGYFTSTCNFGSGTPNQTGLSSGAGSCEFKSNQASEALLIVPYNDSNNIAAAVAIGGGGLNSTSAGRKMMGKITFGWVSNVTGSETGYMSFSTLRAAVITEAMRIFNTGGVSIGNTTDPGAGLLSIGAQLAKAGGSIFDDFADTSSTHTDGTEDDLYTHTTAASTLAANGQALEQTEHVQFVSSATAARRLKKYFGGTLIFDSGSLTLTLGGDFVLTTLIVRESATVVRCSVSVVTTSASTIPYATYTRITGLTLSGTNILKTTGIASGTGAASGDIVNKLSKLNWLAAA